MADHPAVYNRRTASAFDSLPVVRKVVITEDCNSEVGACQVGNVPIWSYL
jgi:hypothetical protein